MNTQITANTKQPKALLPLCTTEMWERFGFYIVQGMLIFLMTGPFNLSDSRAIMVAGIYGALVYISPIIGGYYADNFLGFRYTVLLGACFQCFGYICVATLLPHLTYWGLAFIILGNGFLKPNIASYLGEFYEKNDPRRHAGFTYYYMIMNTGTFIATLSAGFIQTAWGWHVCFGAAAAGMIIGIIIFTTCSGAFKNKGLPVAKALIAKSRTRFSVITLAGCALISYICYILLNHPSIGNTILIIIGGIVLVYLIVLSLRYHGAQRRHLIALITLILLAIGFWAMFFQMFSAIDLFIKRNVDRHLFGITVPPLAFLSLESVFIVIVGWPLAILWKRLAQKKKDPSIAFKFFLALIMLAGAMWLLTIAIHHPDANHLVFPIYMVGFFLLLTIGEMLLSPNLLSAVTELAPPKVVGIMMGVQYMSIGFGSLITGRLGEIAAIPKSVTSTAAMNAIYSHAFNIYALICLCAAGVVLLCTPDINKLIKQKS